MTGADLGYHPGERTEGEDNNTDGEEEQQPNRTRNELRDELFHDELDRGAARPTGSSGELARASGSISRTTPQ
jgi:hypothetical protein